MDEFSDSKSENESESSKFARLSEKKGNPNIHKDFAKITNHLQLISDSLAACQTSSRHRCLRKEHKASNKKCKKWLQSIPVGSSEKEIELKLCPSGHGKDLCVNYIINNRKDFLHRRKSKSLTSREESLAKCYSGESEFGERHERLPSSSNVSSEFQLKSSKVGMYDYREVDSGRVIELLERELKTLARLTPSVVLIISNLRKNLLHCQECRRCHEKILTSLPWILNRIQKLIKYVTTKRQEKYVWPDDFSYLKLNFAKSSLEDKVSSSSSSRVTLIPVTPPKFVGKLERVDPIAVSEDNPGVQLILQVKPELQKKKFFYAARPEKQSKWVHEETFPVVHLKGQRSFTVVEVLRPSATSRILWEKKRELIPLKEYGTCFRVVNLRNSRIAASVTVSVSEGKAIVFESEKFRSSVKSLSSALNNQSFGQLPHSVWKRKPDARETCLKNFRTNAFEPFRNSLTDAEGSEMEKVNVLEEEVKELKDLMLEVHKNQTELGKLLLEKNVISQLMIKLTDPKMLEEENKAVKKASNANSPATSSSTVALQMKVDSLKRKCALKNRLIMTLLKGLRSNIPKELWEEVVAYAFDDSESLDDFDAEKINEFIRQTSLFLTNEEKERRLAPSPSRTELNSAEEEPKVKGIVGAELEDTLKNLSCYEDKTSAKSKGVSSRLEGFPSRVWAYPVLNVPVYTETALRKLENQISILNKENERLWYQINELRELLKNSINEINTFQSDQKISRIRTSGKTLNLVIQIVEKDERRPKSGGYSEVEVADRRSKSSPIVGMARSESITAIHEVERENSFYGSEQKLTLFATEQNYRPRSKPERRLSENDLNNLNDVNANALYYKQENETLRAMLRDKIHPNGRAQGLLMRTPHTSPHDIFQNFKPVVWVPSKHIIPEVSDICGAGPSRKHGEITNLLQKPSLMELTEIQPAGMYASMSNERELQTIPENDADLSSSTLCGVSQAIQRLRTRVRSLHKDMTVFKSRNDRIDKLLDKLMDDVVENSHNYEDIQNSLSSLKSRLN